MKTLKELYDLRQVFHEYDAPIPEKLATEIAEAEKPLLEQVNKYMADNVPQALPDEELQGKVIIALEYDNNELSAIYSAVSEEDCLCLGKMSKLTVEHEIVEEYVEIDEEDEKVITKIKKSPSIPFLVKFEDGKEIAGKDALDTMIEALKYMGLERSSHYPRTFKGFPFIGKRKRTTVLKTGKAIKWQKHVDGWWIYSVISNETKIECLKGVSEFLGIPLTIVMLK